MIDRRLPKQFAPESCHERNENYCKKECHQMQVRQHRLKIRTKPPFVMVVK
jgi:hypothetical protein